MKTKDYQLGEICLRYLFDDEEKHVSMLLLPEGKDSCFEERRTEMTYPGGSCPAWEIGSLCHLALNHHPQGNGAGGTLKYGTSTELLEFKSQTAEDTDFGVEITTVLEAPEHYFVYHKVTYTKGERGLEVTTTFENRTGRAVDLKLLTSFSLDNLSPFQKDSAPYNMYFHRFRGGWSMEGKYQEDSFEDLNITDSWVRAFPESERYGVLGSHPVKRWFPFGCVEDRENNVFWAAQVGLNSSWQMELSRDGDCYSLSGGIADSEFGGWVKTIADGERFEVPKAYVSVSDTSLWDVCQNLTGMFHKYVNRQPETEQDLPIIFNEWCLSWGNPTEEKLVKVADKLKEVNAKYLVIDAGWSKQEEGCKDPQKCNGDWEYEEKQFPNGMKVLSQKVQERGILPGIWMEFEVTTEGASVHTGKWDDLHLKSRGELIQTGKTRRFWDFRKEETRKYLHEKVTDFLRDNEFFYLKVDYNGSIGAGCDGAESPGEGLRTQMAAVLDFFKELRRELPDLVIENCASGGHRLEPSMMTETAMSSFSDAHECLEIPYIAASLHALILPRQSQMWAVICDYLSEQEVRYRMVSTTLGRLCLSGDITELPEEKWEIVKAGCAFYEDVKDIIKDGRSVLYRDCMHNTHHLRGSQVMTRRNGDRMLLTAHSFGEEIRRIEFELPEGSWTVKNAFGEENLIEIKGNKAVFAPQKEWQAEAVLLEKEA